MANLPDIAWIGSNREGVSSMKCRVPGPAFPGLPVQITVYLVSQIEQPPQVLPAPVYNRRQVGLSGIGQGVDQHPLVSTTAVRGPCSSRPRWSIMAFLDAFSFLSVSYSLAFSRAMAT